MRIFLFLLTLVLSSPVLAAPFEAGRNTAIALRADTAAFTPGSDATLAVVIDIREGWHTYWENPGDSGDVLRVKWDAPQGVEIGAFQWPAPKRLPYGPLLNFGYEGRAVILAPVKIADNVKGPVAIKGRAEVLVCEEICIPEFADVSLTLPVEMDAKPANADLFLKAHEAIPEKREIAASWRSGESEFEWRGALSGFHPVALFPAEWGLIDNPSDQKIVRKGNETVITVPKGSRSVDALDDVRFVLVDSQGKGVEVTATKNAHAVSAADEGMPILQAIVFALLGGLILNLMPCVFPVLSMKALKLVKLQNAELREARVAGVAYTAGILFSFAVLAGLLIVLRAAGDAVGWGFQLQSPIITTLLCWVMVVVGFNLLGLFNIGGFANIGAKLTEKHGWLGSFFTGVLAAVVATPCTAPFMATALSVALVQPPFVAMLVFLALGLGLALPFLLLCFVPRLARALPRPGAWMETFRQFLAFPMFMAGVWLAWVAISQTGPGGVPFVAGGVLLIGFLVWGVSHTGVWARVGRVLAWAGLIWLLISLPAMDRAEMEADAFTAAKLQSALESDRPVFVNMTAKWCVTCLVNERVALGTDETQKLFADKNVMYLKGDWTSYDPEITAFLARYGREGVPLYIYYPAAARDKPVVLPQLLTTAIVADALKE